MPPKVGFAGPDATYSSSRPPTVSRVMVFSSGLNPLSRASCPNCGQAAAAAMAGPGAATAAMTRANAAASRSRILIGSSLRIQSVTVRPKVAEVPIGSLLIVIAVTVIVASPAGVDDDVPSTNAARPPSRGVAGKNVAEAPAGRPPAL